MLTIATLNHTITPKSIGLNPALVISLKFELSPMLIGPLLLKIFLTDLYNELYFL